MQGRGLEPNVITYSAVISARELGQLPERALKLLAEAQARGLEPDVITYEVYHLQLMPPVRSRPQRLPPPHPAPWVPA